jgi:hypothetical protein
VHLGGLAHARTTEHREGNGEEKGVKEGIDRCKNLDVLDENRVPEETDNQNVNEKNDKKREENADKARRVLDIDNVFNHLYYRNKKSLDTQMLETLSSFWFVLRNPELILRVQECIMIVLFQLEKARPPIPD